MRSRLLTILVAFVVSACATGGQSAGQSAGPNKMTVVVVNEYTSVVTAYALWNRTRIRLGEVSPQQTKTFSTTRRDRIGLGLEVFSTPPPATGTGPSVMSGGSTPGIKPPLAQTEELQLSPTEGIEFRLTSSGSLLFQILPGEREGGR
jgi:hypothetical protein